MRKSKGLSWLLAVIFVFTTMLGAVPSQAVAADLSDINGHWAQSQINSLISKGVVTGYPDNTFKPDNTITRAEFITMTNRAFSFTATSQINYSDVSATEWYASEISKAKAAGYIAGYEDGTMHPNAQISRQEVAKILAVILKIDSSSDTGASGFSDSTVIPAWSRGYISAMVNAGYINGYPDGSFKANNAINRAEASVILGRALGLEVQTTFTQAGTYGPASGTQKIEGNVVVSTDGVTLQNMNITGNLLIAESVGEGSVYFKNVTASGTTTIKGGGIHSVTFDNCVVYIVMVNKPSGPVRVIFINGSTTSSMQLDSAATIVGSGITKAYIYADCTFDNTPAAYEVAIGVTAKFGSKTVTGPASYDGPVVSGGGGGGGGGPSTVPVTGVTLDKTNLIMNPGQKATLIASVEPANATNKVLLWSSNHPGAADVDQDGVITAVAKGQATITVTDAEGKFSKVCLVDVQVPVEGISLNKLNLNMVYGGNPSTLIPIFTPGDAESDIVWESRDTSIATVIEGVVTPALTGSGSKTTSIVAKTTDGLFTDSCTVTVGEETVPVTGINLNNTDLSLKVGNSFSLIPFVAPANATNTKVIWTSDNNTVATVVNGRVTANANGTAIITVKTDFDNTLQKTCTVSVTPPVSSVTLNPKIINNVEAGDADQVLSATVLPAEASNKNLVWSSSNTAVATFTETGTGTGTVHFVGPGSAIITATTVDGGFADSCTVNVGVRVTAISLEPATMTMRVGGNTGIPQVIPTPAMATNTSAKWISSATDVVTVNEDTGVITPIGAGTATITATPQFAKPGTLPAICVADVFNVTAGQMLKDDRLVRGKTAVSIKFTLNGPTITKNAIVVALNDGTVLQYGSSVAGVYTYTGTTNTLKTGVTYADVIIRGVVSFRLIFPI